MGQFLEFIINHWFLSSLFALLLIIFLINELQQRSRGIPGVSPQELVAMMNHQHAVVVDLRDPEIYAKGHIIGAMNIPHADIETKKSKLNKFKSKPIVLVCTQGTQAGKVGQVFKQAGFEQVFQLAGGIVLWQQEQFPLSKEG